MPVANRQTPQRMGAFLWAKHHPTPTLEISEDICKMNFDCEKQGVHRAVSTAQGYVEICDEAGESPHGVTWQLAPGWRVQKHGTNAFLCVHDEGARVQGAFHGGGITAWEIVVRQASPRFREVVTTQAIAITFHGTLTTVWRKEE